MWMKVHIANRIETNKYFIEKAKKSNERGTT